MDFSSTPTSQPAWALIVVFVCFDIAFDLVVVVFICVWKNLR